MSDESSALDAILKRLPLNRREPFLRIVHLLEVRPDSPDLAQAWLAVEALSPLLESLESAMATLPESMRAAGAEIARSIGGEVGKSASTTLVASLKASMDAHLGDLRKYRAAEREMDEKALQALIRESTASNQTARRSIADVQIAAADACRDVTRYASDIGQRVGTLTEHARRTLYAVVASVLIGTVGAGTLGWLIERQLDHASTYAHGWQDGAAAARSHMYRAGES